VRRIQEEAELEKVVELEQEAFSCHLPHFCFNTPMAGPRREVKLPYREMNIGCPHCRAPLIIGTVMDTILLSRRSCPKCHKEFQEEAHEVTLATEIAALLQATIVHDLIKQLALRKLSQRCPRLSSNETAPNSLKNGSASARTAETRFRGSG